MSIQKIEQLLNGPQKSEVKSLSSLCSSRKKENFAELKQWDENRAKKLVIHRKVCDQIDQTLQLKLEQSNAYLQVVQRFLLNNLQQKKLYESNVVTDPSHKLSQNFIGKNVHLLTSRVLNKLYSQSKNVQQSKPLMNSLQQGIKMIEDLMEEGNRDILDIRTKMELSILEIQNCNLNTAQSCSKLMGDYNRDKNSKAFKADCDFLTSQQQFMAKAIKQMEAENDLGSHLVSYMSYMESFEKKKVTLVKAILKKFMEYDTPNKKKYQSLYGIIEKSTQIQYISLFYDPEDLISRQLLVEICTVFDRLDCEKMDIAFIIAFLKKLKVDSFDNRNLILKEYKVYCKLEGQLEEAMLIISVDGYLHVTGGHQSSLEEIDFDYSYRIDGSLGLEPEGDLTLFISQKKRSLMNFMGEIVQNQLELVFSEEDQREELCQFTEKITK